MKTWKIYVTFFKNLYDDHYKADRTWNPGNFGFMKVNDRFPLELADNRLPYEILVEHDFPVNRPDFQENGYCESSVIWHLYKNGEHKKYDYIGFIEYDHVLSENFTETIQHVGTRLGYMHFADNNRLAPGQGHIPFPVLLEALAKVQYSGFISAEILPLPDDETALHLTSQYMNQLIHIAGCLNI